MTSSEKVYETPREQDPPVLRMPENHPGQVVPATISHALSPAKLVSLLHAVEKNMQTAGTPVILFMGAHEGVGADNVAFETAYAGARTGKRVLFIDTNGSASGVIRQLRSKVPMPLNIASGGEVESIAPFVNVEGTSLFFATFDEYKERHSFFPDRRAHIKIIDELRPVFDLIVVYSESGLSNPLATILSGLADASVLVVQEGRTRIPVIRDLRRLVDMHGGRVVGVVMNKCRSYIPPSVYKALFSF